MTDLDRKAATLMGKEIDSLYEGAVVYEHHPGVIYGRKFSPTTNPADTRELVRYAVSIGFTITIWVSDNEAQCIVQHRDDRSVSLGLDTVKPVRARVDVYCDEGPNYAEIAQTRACVAALESMEARK